MSAAFISISHKHFLCLFLLFSYTLLYIFAHVISPPVSSFAQSSSFCFQRNPILVQMLMPLYH
jgi:hypothetical protein